MKCLVSTLSSGFFEATSATRLRFSDFPCNLSADRAPLNASGLPPRSPGRLLTRLPNGLHLIVREDHRAPAVPPQARAGFRFAKRAVS